MTRELFFLCFIAGTISASLVLAATKTMKSFSSEQTLGIMFLVSAVLLFAHMAMNGTLPSLRKPISTLLVLAYSCLACTVGNLIVFGMWKKATEIGSNMAYPYALHTGLAAVLAFIGTAVFLQGDFSIKRAGGILLIIAGGALLK